MAEPGSLVAAEGDPKIGDVPTWTTTDGPDGHAEWSAPGGGSQPESGDYSGNPVTINNGASSHLTWDSFNVGTELLDRTNPATPLFLAAGAYTVQVYVAANALTALGSATVTVGTNGTVSGVSGPNIMRAADTEFLGQPSVFVTTTVVVAAGDALLVDVTNHDGAAPANFSLFEAQVIKIA